jgi:PTH1 family peptidyl-tRNA hydrolase
MKKSIIFGLGNPGKEYEAFRHNIGSRIVKILKDDPRVPDDVLILLPEVFVNESGKQVKYALSFYKVALRNLLVVHDDSDILFGKFKLSFGSRSAGHHGVESIIQELRSKDFWRLRIGIQPQNAPSHIRAEELVLKPFSEEEEKLLPDIIDAAKEAIIAWIRKT